MINSSCRWRYSKGTSLLEVMIAAVILGVGLLGIAALQMASLQGSSNSEYRGRASDLAWTLADRMRANLPGIADYTSPVASNCTAPATSCAMTPGSTVAATICTPTQIAAYDLWETRCSNGVRTSLPGGTMLVTSTTNADGVTANITITWQTRTVDNVGQDITDSRTLFDSLSMTVMPGTDPGL